MDDPEVWFLFLISLCLVGLLMPAEAHLLVLLSLIGLSARAYLALRSQALDADPRVRERIRRVR